MAHRPLTGPLLAPAHHPRHGHDNLGPVTLLPSHAVAALGLPPTRRHRQIAAPSTTLSQASELQPHALDVDTSRNQPTNQAQQPTTWPAYRRTKRPVRPTRLGPASTIPRQDCRSRHRVRIPRTPLPIPAASMAQQIAVPPRPHCNH
ncbi:uncharacterized protein PSFLO_01051 [Pseudozyma flocculosa]|uniref:Uncharacterized protein n=1 Tax=Pseudozyma flocculosa TaxID=84751 RepID=A0A5C3EUR0_9BASI|nr:uncharacterized protein PSFLO_01051 [Pseudozyma flocculosa]